MSLLSSPLNEKSAPGASKERFAVTLRCQGYGRFEAGFPPQLRDVPEQLADAGLEQEV